MRTMKSDSKVYDYNKDKVRSTLLSAFKKHRGEAVVADLVAFTGLPKYQVETELPALADEYRGRLKVTESGEILYSFPQGYSSRYRGFVPGFKRFWNGLVRGVSRVLAFLFKIWIMVMLVGYFVVFLALAVLAIVASIAGSMAGNRGSSSRSRSSGGGLFLATRLLDLFVRIWFYNEILKGPSQRGTAFGRSNAKKGRPLHKAIFSFVFGEPDPNAAHDQVVRQTFVSMVQARKGIILIEEFMALTGLPMEQAELAISRFLYEFEGSPEVSENGTVYYHFPALLKRSRQDSGVSATLPHKKIRPFSANDSKSNSAYALINGVNVLFGGFFLGAWATYGELILREGMKLPALKYFYGFVYTLLDFAGANPDFVIPVILGIVPIVFSVFFWLVPAVRALRVRRENDAIKKENLAREIYARVLDNPRAFSSGGQNLRLLTERTADTRLVDDTLSRLAAVEGGEPAADGTWHFADLARKLDDVAGLRAKVQPEDYGLGKTIFDSDS